MMDIFLDITYDREVSLLRMPKTNLELTEFEVLVHPVFKQCWPSRSSRMFQIHHIPCDALCRTVWRVTRCLRLFLAAGPSCMP